MLIRHAAILAMTASLAAAQPADQPERARPRLICEQTALVPGATAWLGISFDIDKDWHLYWNGLSDTGIPIDLEPSFPDGYKPGEVLWPAPRRHLTQDFLDHIYESRVTLLMPVQVPAAARIGDKITFNLHTKWLVCKQACLPGEADLALTLPVAATASPGDQARRFTEARANLPKPLDKSRPEVRIEWTADSIKLTGPDAAKGMAFYPARECVAFKDLPTQGQASSRALDLQLDKPTAADRLVGVVEIGPGEPGPRTLFTIDSTRPNPSKPGASDTKQPRGG